VCCWEARRRITKRYAPQSTAATLLHTLGKLQQRAVGSARLEDDQRDLAPGAPLVVGVAAVGLHGPRPQPPALIGRRDPGSDRAALRAHPDRRLRADAQVVKPGRMARMAALGGEDDQVRSVLEVKEGGGASMQRAR
jgi:hypothetical protein